MITENINRYVPVALRWMGKVKSLPADKRRNCETLEFRFLVKATEALFSLYSDIIDPNTSYMYERSLQELAERYAWPVECMIYRLQEVVQTGPAERKADALTMLACLNRVSDQLLPIAVPVGVYVPVVQHAAGTLKKYSRTAWWLLAGIVLIQIAFFTLKYIST